MFGRLLKLAEQKAPEVAQAVRRIQSVILEVGWTSPESAATAMLAVKSGLVFLDEIGVREAPCRTLRTRLTAEEVAATQAAGKRVNGSACLETPHADTASQD